MAIKGERNVIDTDISFFMNQTAEPGGAVSFSTAGSGASMDNAAALVAYAGTTSGSIPFGLLLSNVVDLDLTRQHANWYKDEVQKGGKVTVLTKGNIVTNMIVSGVTPAVGNSAYLGPDGQLTSTDTGAIASPIVGKFLSIKDEDGYAKVSVNLPTARS